MRRRDIRKLRRNLRKPRDKVARRGRRTARVDLEVFFRDEFTCVYCGFDGKKSVDQFMLLSIDHLIPKSLGGSEYVDNLVCACIPCNRLKGHFDCRDEFPHDNDTRNEDTREAMIAANRTEIQRRRDVEDKDFQRIIKEFRIAQDKANSSSDSEDHGT